MRCEKVYQISRDYLEQYCVYLLKNHFNENFRQSTEDEDKAQKIDVVNESKENSNAQVKTRQPNRKNYTIHTLDEIKNNKYLLFYDKPFSDDLIVQKNLNEQDNLINYLNDSIVYLVETESIKGKLKEMKSQNGDTYYLAFADDVEDPKNTRLTLHWEN